MDSLWLVDTWVTDGPSLRERHKQSDWSHVFLQKAEAAVNWLLLQARLIKSSSPSLCRPYYYSNGGCMHLSRSAYMSHLLCLIRNQLNTQWFLSPFFRASARGSHHFTIWSKCPYNYFLLPSSQPPSLLLAPCLQSWCHRPTWSLVLHLI